MTKDEVVAKIKAILSKDPLCKGVNVEVKFSNKKKSKKRKLTK